MESRPSSPSKLRRKLLQTGLLVGAGSLSPTLARAALVATPRQTEGPFYPTLPPLDSDSDLVQIAGQDGSAEGQVLHVFGQVLDQSGKPLPGALVEIWQCDALGRYHHPRDGGGADPRFQGYGRMTVDDDGRYRFRTIRPVPYTGRTPHIHFAVSGPSLERLTTQMYVEGEPRNAGDFVLRRVQDPAARARLIVPLVDAPELEAGALSGRFDIVLDDRLVQG